MKKPVAALAIIANRFECGGERFDALLKSTKLLFKNSEVELLEAPSMVWDMADAVKACSYFKTKSPDLLILIHASWVQDSVQYLFTNSLRLPTVLLAVPFLETFSLACVQHYSAQLTRRGIPCLSICTDLNRKDHRGKVERFAHAARIARKLRNTNCGMIGNRQTWRIAAAQDMTGEEWDFSENFGPTIVHIDTDELLALAKKQSQTAISAVATKVKSMGLVNMLENGRLDFCSSVYLAVKELKDRYELSFAAAQCYPNNGGIANLASALLADENFVLDTEGDIGHATLLYMCSLIDEKPSCLSEIGAVCGEGHFYLEHEGSTALSLADAVKTATLRDCGDGSMLGFRLKPNMEATALSMGETDHGYMITALEGSTVEARKSDWDTLNGRFLGAFKPRDFAAEKAHDEMIQRGVDHHFVLKPGLHGETFKYLCQLLGFDYFSL